MNRGPHRPELRALPVLSHANSLQIANFGFCPPSLRNLGFCGRFPAIGHRIRLCAQSVPTDPEDPRRLRCSATLDARGGRRPSGRPAPPQRRDDTRGGPAALGQPPLSLPPTPSGVGSGPVVGGRKLPVPGLPLGHRSDHELARPLAFDRARMAALAVRVGVPLAVAGLGVGAAAPAHADVAGLDRPRLLAGRVVGV